MEGASGSRKFNFAVEVPSRRPRAWERAPKSPAKSHRQGKKVWKRYEVRRKEVGFTTRDERDGGVGQESEVVATPGRRPVKRLRNAPGLGGREGAALETKEYVTTLREKAPGTPKRKTAGRKSLRPDLFRSAANKEEPVEDAPVDVPPPVVVPSQDIADLERSVQCPQLDFADIVRSPGAEVDEFEEDDPRARDCLPSEDVKEGPVSTTSSVVEGGSIEDEVEKPEHSPLDNNEDLAPNTISEETVEPVEPEEVETSREPSIDGEEITVRLPSEVGTPHISPTKPVFVFGTNVDYEAEILPESSFVGREAANAESSSVGLSTPRNPPSHTPHDRPGAATNSDCNVSISRTPSAEPVSPNQHTIGKLDITSRATVNKTALKRDAGEGLITCQEEKSDDNGEKDHIDSSDEVRQSSDVEYQDLALHSTKTSTLDVSASPDIKTLDGHGRAGNCPEDEQLRITERDNEASNNTEDELSSGERSMLPESSSPIPSCEPKKSVLHNESSAAQVSSTRSTDEEERADKIDDWGTIDQPGERDPQPTEEIAGTTIGSRPEDSQGDAIREYAAIAPRSMANSDAIANMPIKTTRSGARFSDDTNLLKDFLNRAQATKMTKDIQMPAGEPPAASPRRSPRKVLSELTSNSPSPHKPKDLANRPGTPPGKQRLDAFSFDDVDELTAEPTSCRRSTRTRLPAPAKAPAGAPSFIPVRRADGTDPVILQKSMAQELAVQTRANTRRNKGQSKPPSLALQNLTAETVETSSTRMHAHESSKSVGWDERLVYYHDLPDAAEEEGKEVKRPKVRRLRDLGAANGTPAAKKLANVAIPHGTPAPRRKGKLR